MLTERAARQNPYVGQDEEAVQGRLLVRTGPGLTPVCRATTFLIQPDVKSQPPEERLMWLTARGRRIPWGHHLARLVGSPAHEADGPLGRCWQRRTIDRGKAPPTLAALQRQLAHRNCPWRLANATIHICLRDGPGAGPPPGP